MNNSTLFTTIALTLAACSDVSDLDETESELGASYKANIKNRTLSIVGNNADSRLSLRLSATSQLEIDVGDDGSADFTFDRSKFERISIDASGGNDVVTMDERFGAFTTEEQITINGGSGNDTITGGFGAETIAAGGGNDIVNGRGGIDTISLGAGDDVVLWQPGDQSDVIEGGDGFDALVFTGNIGEDIDLSAVGDRLRLTRNVASIAMDIHALERVELHTQGGVDRVFIHDLSPAQVAEVDVDLLASSGGDLAADEVWLDTTAAADTIHVALDAGAVTATGLATEVRIVNGESALDRLYVNAGANDRVNIDGSAGADAMSVIGDASGWFFDGGGYGVLVAPSLAANVTVNGLGGDDTITASTALVAQLVLDGGEGNDVIIGGSGPDVLRGGPGNDIVDGRLGADFADLGDGDDTFVWNPGNASDIVEGGAGVDTLRFVTGNVADSVDVRANGSRVRVLRDIASVVMDLGGIEHLDLRTRGGNDTITVGTLTGTAANTIDVDLAQADGMSGGDAAADRIVIDGATVVQADGNAVAVTGFGGTLRVVNGDPSLDRIATSATTLTVDGTPAADTMTVMVDGTAPVYDGGGYNILVAPSAATAVTVKGNGGDDWIGTNGGVATPLVFDGGDGNDTLIGGAGADLLLGGAGADVVHGKLGADTILLGDGDDTAVWDPGDASDVIEGGAGSDTLVFSGSNIGETIELAANAARVRVARNIGSVVLDLGTLERIDLRARGGADAIVVGDLTGTAVNRVSVDLGDFTGAPDGVVDTLTLVGSPDDDRIDISADAGAVVVAGLAAIVRITGADLIDQLAVHGGSGADTYGIGLGVDGLMWVMTYD